MGTGFNFNTAGNAAVQSHLDVMFVLPNNANTSVRVSATEDSAGTGRELEHRRSRALRNREPLKLRRGDIRMSLA